MKSIDRNTEINNGMIKYLFFWMGLKKRFTSSILIINKILLIICNHEVENDRRSRVLDIVIELFTTLIKRDINLITDITSDLMILDIKTAIDLFRCWISSDNLSGLYFILTIKMLNTGVYRNLFYSDFDYQQLNKILNLFFQKINVQSIDQFIFIKQLNFFRFMSRECQKFELQVIDNDFNTLKKPQLPISSN